jgi:hypothetical protein
LATAGAEVGIIFRGEVGAFAFPGTCTLDSSRLCLSDGDCNLPSVDVTSKGSCVGITSQHVDWPGEDNVLESNALRGPFTRSGIAVSTIYALTEHKHLTGDDNRGIFTIQFHPQSKPGNPRRGQRISKRSRCLRRDSSPAGSGWRRATDRRWPPWFLANTMTDWVDTVSVGRRRRKAPSGDRPRGRSSIPKKACACRRPVFSPGRRAPPANLAPRRAAAHWH